MLKVKYLFFNSSGSPFKSAELACIKLIHIKNILKSNVIQNKVVIELSDSHLRACLWENHPKQSGSKVGQSFSKFANASTFFQIFEYQDHRKKLAKQGKFWK
jgi:hypothetical protein